MIGDSVNEPRLIGVAGVSGAGKDVVASILIARRECYAAVIVNDSDRATLIRRCEEALWTCRSGVIYHP